jgi:hypothetical protein
MSLVGDLGWELGIPRAVSTQDTTKDEHGIKLCSSKEDHVALRSDGHVTGETHSSPSYITVTGALRDLTHVCTRFTLHWYRRLVKQSFDLSSHEFRVKRFSIFRSNEKGIYYFRLFYLQGRNTRQGDGYIKKLKL